MRRNKFSLSHYKLLTFDMGKLIPVACYPVIPGDTVQQQSQLLVRLSPLVNPVMHPVVVRLHSFYVPNRLMWDAWPDWITGEDASSAHPHYLDPSLFNAKDVVDYMGYPCPGKINVKHNSLPMRAYWMIADEFYRDQDLETPINVDTSHNGDDQSKVDYVNIHGVSWEKDYYTTARPWADKGDDITVPVKGLASEQSTVPGSSIWSTVDGASATGNYDATWVNMDDGLPRTYVDVEDIRLAGALKRYQEARAKYGSRYTEYLRYCMPGVRISDGRLQNPEYLGGSRQIISFSEVLATAENTTAGVNVGDMYGHGIAGMRSGRWRRFFEEHGWVITLVSVVPKMIIDEVTSRHFFVEEKEDYFTKELQDIGEQELYNKEVYANHTTPEGIFGYQERYSHYKTHPSSCHGEMRAGGIHRTYHYARQFSSDPALNSTFIKCEPTKRPHQDTTNHNIWVMASHSIQARRMIRSNSRPKIM